MKKHTLDDTWNIILEDNPRGNKEATLKVIVMFYVMQSSHLLKN